VSGNFTPSPNATTNGNESSGREIDIEDEERSHSRSGVAVLPDGRRITGAEYTNRNLPDLSNMPRAPFSSLNSIVLDPSSF
jgi:hypothetical protein